MTASGSRPTAGQYALSLLMGLALAAAIGLALAGLLGCSPGASSSTASPPPSAASVAQRLGCTGISAVSPPTLYAYDEVTATCGGHAADIATFRTDQLRDQWVQVARQFAGIEQTGHLYAVADG